MDDTVRIRGALAQAVEVFEIAVEDFSAGGAELFGSGFRTGEPEDGVACLDEVRDEEGTDEAGGSGNKNAHGTISCEGRPGCAVEGLDAMESGTIYTESPYEWFERPE